MLAYRRVQKFSSDIGASFYKAQMLGRENDRREYLCKIGRRRLINTVYPYQLLALIIYDLSVLISAARKKLHIQLKKVIIKFDHLVLF